MRAGQSGLFVYKKALAVGEMARVGKCLLCKLKDLIPDSQLPWIRCTWQFGEGRVIPALGRRERQRLMSPELVSWPVTLPE